MFKNFEKKNLFCFASQTDLKRYFEPWPWLTLYLFKNFQRALMIKFIRNLLFAQFWVSSKSVISKISNFQSSKKYKKWRAQSADVSRKTECVVSRLWLPGCGDEINRAKEKKYSTKSTRFLIQLELGNKRTKTCQILARSPGRVVE